MYGVRWSFSVAYILLYVISIFLEAVIVITAAKLTQTFKILTQAVTESEKQNLGLIKLEPTA